MAGELSKKRTVLGSSRAGHRERGGGAMKKTEQKAIEVKE